MKQFSAFYDTPRFSTVHNSPPRFPPLSQINQAYIVTPHLISSLILFRYSCPVVLINLIINGLTPNDPYMGRTAPLTSKRCILYTYSTNIGTEYFKHILYSPFFSLQNAVCFIMLTSLVPVFFTFYTQDVLKF